MSGDMRAESEIPRVELQAKVIRADGRVEDLGTVAYYHKNPVRRLVWRLFKIAT